MLPSKVNTELAKAYLKADYENVCSQGLPQRYEWSISPPSDDLVLHVKLWSRDESDLPQDDYYLRMTFEYYNSWPPGVTFVNPETDKFESSRDMEWLPKIAAKPLGTDFGFNPSTALQDGTTRQLVCNSMILEYYLSNHTPNDQEKWDPNRHNFGTTLSTIQLILRKPYYGGRSS